MKIPESIKNLIASTPLAHLTTLNSDGSPHVTVSQALAVRTNN
jgi:hypothetical protein